MTEICELHLIASKEQHLNFLATKAKFSRLNLKLFFITENYSSRNKQGKIHSIFKGKRIMIKHINIYKNGGQGNMLYLDMLEA